MQITYKETHNVEEGAIKYLYENAKWTNYTKDMPTLLRAIKHSLAVITAWDGNHLVGLIRVVGDGQTIIYIQDILVLEHYQNRGVGSELMKRIVAKYKHVRQKVLLTNDAVNVRAFLREKWIFIL